jgi:membrane protein
MMDETKTDRFIQFREAACAAPVLGILVRAALRGAGGHVKDMAASIAFFSFLSLFPLILGVIALASSVLKSEQLREQVTQWVSEFFPVGSDFVTQNIESMVRLRGAAGLASVVLLFWSARKMVGAISRGINSALEQKRGHAFYLSPLRNFALVVAISLLMFGTVAISPLADLVSGLDPKFLGEYWGDLLDLIGGHMISITSTGVMIGCTYFLVPYHRTGWNAIWPGLVAATFLIEVGKKAFVYYVDNISSMDALYGSISSIIALMLWLYFFGRVLLYGAEVNFVYGSSRQRVPAEHPEGKEKEQS